jgi:hypothetical protein
MGKSVDFRVNTSKFTDSSISQSKFLVPSCIFDEKLSSFETIVKFLKESYGLGFEEIARLLGKTKQSVWRAYKTSVSKTPDSFHVSDLHYPIPAEIFRESNATLLETLVFFLKETYLLSFSEISSLLMRDETTIWTVYHRAKEKNAKLNNAKKE